MSEVLNRLKKKRGYPVVIDEETFYVRSLTIGEFKRLGEIQDDQRTGFTIGCALCSDDKGEPEIPQKDGEADSAWAERVLEELADVPSETIRALAEGVASLSKTPKASAVAKNS